MPFAFRPYLRLCRFPAVFTAMADIFLGYLLCHATLGNGTDFACLLLASSGLYLAGMVFNDVFDIAQDTRERPQRPIPSGAVSLKQAILFGSLLTIVGLVAAAIAGRNSLVIAILLVITIFAYDGAVKSTPLGPIFMGTCRFLNILLGASTAGAAMGSVYQMPQVWVAGSMGLYVAGVTWFGRQEARQSPRAQLVGATIVVNIALLGLAAWITEITVPWGLLIGAPGVANPLSVMFLWGMIAVTINRRTFAAISRPTPDRVQPAMGTMLLSIVMLDAMLIYFKLGTPGLVYALVTVALLIPAILLRRWIAIT